MTPFTPTELTVIRIARAEGGRGLPPRSVAGRALSGLWTVVSGRPAALPFPHARLEALRIYVNALATRRGARGEDTSRLYAAGFGPEHEAALA